MLGNILKLFLFIIIFCSTIASAAVTIEYTEDGVLRKDGNCDITFVNFGIEKTISGQSVKKTLDKETGTFNITLSGLVNGNVGLNYETKFELEDLYKYIKVIQDNEEISTISIPSMNTGSGKFDLVIYNLVSCDGLMVKQTFKDETVTVANRLYYVNVVPESINRAFQSSLFGPSYDYPFERIHWKMNEGLDDLRKTCGIYIKYDKFVSSNGNHWQYYLSVDSINSKECSQKEFFNVIRRNYIDYHFTRDLLGENYMGYVLKREGHIEAHMDGVIADNHYIIEIYQKSCNEKFSAKTVCTLTSDEPLTFQNFTKQLIKQCIGNTVDEIEESEEGEEIDKENEKDSDKESDKESDEENDEVWEVLSTGKSATGKLKNQNVKIENFDRGSLPKKIEGNITYKNFDIENSTPVARFVVTYTCECGTFMSDNCQCNACPANCESCLNATTCTKCIGDNRILNENGECECKANYFEDPVTKQCEPCKKECASCNSKNSCTVCKDPTAIFSDGKCICENSFIDGEGLCYKCDGSCSECDEFGCVACADPLKTPNEDGKC